MEGVSIKIQQYLYKAGDVNKCPLHKGVNFVSAPMDHRYLGYSRALDMHFVVFYRG